MAQDAKNAAAAEKFKNSPGGKFLNWINSIGTDGFPEPKLFSVYVGIIN